MSREREERLQLFGQLVNSPDREIPLCHAALLFSGDGNGQLDVNGALMQIRELGATAAEAVGPLDYPGQEIQALRRFLKAFHRDLKFQGDQDHFDAPENSHLHSVLERRRGLPIMLSVLAVEMLRQAGLEAYGVALPGRYIARCETESGPLWFDPFTPGSGEGTLLDEADCLDLARSHGAALGPSMVRQALGPARNHSTLVRMLNNLIGSYDRRGMHMEKARTFDWLLLLQPGDMDLILSRGLAYHDAAMPGLAMRDYERYLRGRPQGVHSVMVRQRLESMHREHPQN